MHVNLMKVLWEFLQPLPDMLENSAVADIPRTQPHRRELLKLAGALKEMRAVGEAFTLALSEYAADDSALRRPEKLRSATTNMIRATESFKKRFSIVCPESDINNHPLVGCLYGYARPRTATLDKAALVAQETMIDIWSLTETELHSLVFTTIGYYRRLGKTTNVLRDMCEREAVYGAVA